ncbi:MAG: acetyl-CoA carboxylase [Frankiaceae bacterium]
MTDRTIKALLPGVFYRRPSPDAEPYVTEGQQVRGGDTVAVVELMKSFHEVTAEESGVLQRFLVEDGDAVEAGQDVAVLGE